MEGIQMHKNAMAIILLMICFLPLSLRAEQVHQVVAAQDKLESSVAGEQISLQEAINRIEKKFDVNILFKTQEIQNRSVAKQNTLSDDLTSELERLLEPLDMTYEQINAKNYIIYDKEEPVLLEVVQETVTGTVTDANTGETLPGVNILVKGTTTGTSTDQDGIFELEVPTLQDTLVVSFIGYQTREIPINSRRKLDVALVPQAIAGDELVVVGYGEQQQENLTGAVEQIGIENLENRAGADITKSLQGLMPGLNIQVNSGDPTEAPDINIRGFNSINGGNPLVLIDGIEGNITDINPQDIENVTVLKDAASAAIYGGRGAFGVILITTKTGQAGDMVVEYTNNFSWTTPVTRTDFVTDPYVHGKTIDAAIFGYNGSSYTGYDEDDWETIQLVANGEIEPFHEEQPNGTYKFFHKTDWYDYLFKKWQPSQNHNISVSGGTEKLQGYLSARIHERETIQDIVNADMKRYNLKLNLNFQPTEWLELSSNSLFIHSKDENFGGAKPGYRGIWSAHTWFRLYSYLPNEIDGMPFDHHGSGIWASLEDANSWRRFDTEQFTNTFRAKIAPIEGLELNIDYSNEFENDSRTFRTNEFEYLTSNRITLETVGVNRLNEYRWKDRYNAMNVFGTYTFDLADKHNFKALLGYNQEEFDRDRIAASQDGLLVRDLANLSLGTDLMFAEGSAQVWAVQGYFGRFNYNYDRKYLLEVNARYDGSSRFPEDSRWGFFPSVSAGWQISREDFWDPIKNVINTLKFRASYGELGNQSVGVNTFRQLMAVGRSSWLDQGERINYASAPGPLPRVVSWERTRTIDFGVDLGFFQDKLTTTFDWYERETDGMYLPGEPLPAVFGASEPRENFASLRNRGFEFSLNYNDNFTVGGAPLSISATASVSDFNGVITKFENPEGLMSSYWEGQELGQIWGYHVDGQFQSDEEAQTYQDSFENPSNSLGNVYRFILNIAQNNEWNRLKGGDLKYVDTNGDGRIDRGSYTLEDHGDLQPIGNAMPQFPFGFNLNANWKGFDLAVAGAGVAKQNWYPTGNIYWGTYQRPYMSFLRKDLVNNAWSPENPEGTYPQIERGYAALGSNRSLYEMNDYYLKNVGYLRVKNLTLGYTLPQDVTTRLFNARKLRIYFSGENILTWRFGDLSKYIDPEQAANAINFSNPGSAVARSGVESYPMGKTYSIGISVTF